jgi:hypothetical protein
VQHIVIMPQHIIIGMPAVIIAIIRSQHCLNISADMPSIGFISQVMPSAVILQVIVAIIMGIIPFIIGMAIGIIPFIIGIMPPIIGMGIVIGIIAGVALIFSLLVRLCIALVLCDRVCVV